MAKSQMVVNGHELTFAYDNGNSGTQGDGDSHVGVDIDGKSGASGGNGTGNDDSPAYKSQEL